MKKLFLFSFYLLLLASCQSTTLIDEITDEMNLKLGGTPSKYDETDPGAQYSGGDVFDVDLNILCGFIPNK